MRKKAIGFLLGVSCVIVLSAIPESATACHRHRHRSCYTAVDEYWHAECTYTAGKLHSGIWKGNEYKNNKPAAEGEATYHNDNAKKQGEPNHNAAPVVVIRVPPPACCVRHR